MAHVTLDTSGAVPACGPTAPGTPYWPERRWSDLSPFVQGYVEALFATSWERWTSLDEPRGHLPLHKRSPGFSDLSPEALALILRDCEAALADRRLAYHPTATGGRLFCSERQKGLLNGDVPRFPPLTVSLGDDGKVHLTEASQ